MDTNVLTVENPGGDSHPLGIGGSTYRYAKEYWLVVEPTHLKNISQIGSWNPKVRGENKNYLKPPGRIENNSEIDLSAHFN